MIPYTLAALDPRVPASERHVAQAMEILVKQWKAVRDHFGSEPVLVLRAVIAEALRRVGKGNPRAAAVIWYSAASYAPQMEVGAEAEIWAGLLQELAGIAEEHAIAVWDGTAAPPIKLPDLKVPKISLQAAAVDASRLSQVMTAAGGANGGDAGAYDRNDYQSCVHANTHTYNWNNQFGTIAGAGIAALVSDALKKTAAGAGGLSEIEGAINSYMSEVGVTFSRAIAPVEATALRTRLLWWKESAYSPGLRCGYHEIDVYLRSFVMAADLHDQVPMVTPRSVDYFLADAVGLGTTAAEAQPVDSYVGALRAAGASVAVLLPKGKGVEGRIPLLEVIRRGVLEENTAEVHTGLAPDMRLSPADFAVWMFRDLQARRLATQR